MILTRFFDESGQRVNPGQYFFGGAKPPKPPKQEKIKFPEQPQMAPPAPIQLPPMPEPVPPPAPIPPAPTASKMEVQQASDDQRKQAAKDLAALGRAGFPYDVAKRVMKADPGDT